MPGVERRPDARQVDRRRGAPVPGQLLQPLDSGGKSWLYAGNHRCSRPGRPPRRRLISGSYVTWGSVPQLVFRLARPGDPWAGRHPHPGLISAGPEAGRRSLNGLLAMKRRPAITASRCPRFPSKPECLEREPRSHHSWAVRSREAIGSTWWIPSPTRQSPRVERSRSRAASAAASGSARAGCAGSRRQQLCIGPRLVATLRRLRLYRNSIPRGASATELVAIE